jgi:hypothetical protein
MPRRITEDHKEFRDVVGGKIRQSLGKFIKTGKIFKTRGNGKISVTIPRIEIPHIVFGDGGESGIARGEGKDGETIGREPSGQGQAGDSEGEGIVVNISMEEVLKFMQNELSLPNLQPKENDVFDEIKIKYNNIAPVGPESLRHNKKTWLQALKRTLSEGKQQEPVDVPGCETPMSVIQPIPQDKRYRQYKEIKKPSSNALIIYARDGSGSMDENKCNIVSDVSWWLDIWIRRFYKKVDRLFVWHDTVAMEVDENKFYNYRYGGGTVCSSALKFILKQLENRYTPDKWNIYVFYFTDGENWQGDNEVFVETLKKEFGPKVINFTGIVQIQSWSYNDTLKYEIDRALSEGSLNEEYFKTAEISSKSVESTELQILNAIKKLLGAKT